MLPFFVEDFGNPSSQTHAFGWRAEAAVEDARERLARAIGAADPREIVFTSGTTESDNLALKGVARAGRRRGDHLITVETEHPAVLDACRALEAEGFRVTRLPVDAEGLVDPDDVARALTRPHAARLGDGGEQRDRRAAAARGDRAHLPRARRAAAQRRRAGRRQAAARRARAGRRSALVLRAQALRAEGRGRALRPARSAARAARAAAARRRPRAGPAARARCRCR